MSTPVTAFQQTIGVEYTLLWRRDVDFCKYDESDERAPGWLWAFRRRVDVDRMWGRARFVSLLPHSLGDRDVDAQDGIRRAFEHALVRAGLAPAKVHFEEGDVETPTPPVASMDDSAGGGTGGSTWSGSTPSSSTARAR